VARFKIYQGEQGGLPDYVLFQSWQPHPELCLPESDPSAFTGVIDAYISATTTLPCPRAVGRRARGWISRSIPLSPGGR
jgi:hypothetical protein